MREIFPVIIGRVLIFLQDQSFAMLLAWASLLDAFQSSGSSGTCSKISPCSVQSLLGGFLAVYGL